MSYATDILAYQHDLKEAGVPEKQAEIHAKRFAELCDEKLVTKEYAVNQLATKLDLSKLKIEILVWMVGLFIGQTALLVTLLNMKFH